MNHLKCTVCAKIIIDHPYCCLKCQKIAHKECLLKSFRINGKCPMCLSYIQEIDIKQYRIDIGDFTSNRRLPENTQFCPIHKKPFLFYDLKCKKPLCIPCRNNHRKCEIFEIKEINKKINDSLKKIKDDIKTIEMYQEHNNRDKNDIMAQGIEIGDDFINEIKVKKNILSDDISSNLENGRIELFRFINTQKNFINSYDKDDVDYLTLYKNIKYLDNIALYNSLSNAYLNNSEIYSNIKNYLKKNIDISKIVPNPKTFTFYQIFSKKEMESNGKIFITKELPEKFYSIPLTIVLCNILNKETIQLDIHAVGPDLKLNQDVYLNVKVKVNGENLLYPIKIAEKLPFKNNILTIKNVIETNKLCLDNAYFFKVTIGFDNYVEFLQLFEAKDNKENKNRDELDYYNFEDDINNPPYIPKENNYEYDEDY